MLLILLAVLMAAGESSSFPVDLCRSCFGGFSVSFTFILRLASCCEEISACSLRRLPASFECLPFLRFRWDDEAKPSIPSSGSSRSLRRFVVSSSIGAGTAA
uniref:Putative secreted protein n=1 Tax=Anopheles darlingi TaxID=43151 RepID=A0A2M4DB33_ANODA